MSNLTSTPPTATSKPLWCSETGTDNGCEPSSTNVASAQNLCTMISHDVRLHEDGARPSPEKIVRVESVVVIEKHLKDSNFLPTKSALIRTHSGTRTSGTQPSSCSWKCMLHPLKADSVALSMRYLALYSCYLMLHAMRFLLNLETVFQLS